MDIAERRFSSVLKYISKKRYKLKALIGLTTALVSTLGSMAFAGSLAGEYNVTQKCSITFQGQTVVIPTGKLVISENIPVSEGLGTNFNAVILQSNGAATPVLALGIGKVQPFSYGLQPYSIGAYDSTNSEFHVSYFTPKANLGSTLNQTVRLFATGIDTELVAVDELNNKSAICSFGQKL